MIYDIVTYNGERELLELRLNILSPYVDKFIIVEFDKTFSGKDKPFYGGKDMDKFLEPWKGKVEWYYNTEKTWGKYWEEAKKSPNTNYGEGAKHWIREWCQKECITDYLTFLKDSDTLYIGDIDEIWQPFPIDEKSIFKLKLRVYTYFLNNRSTEQFWGTIVGKCKNIKGKCLNHIRSKDHTKTTTDWGWHFTSLKNNLKNKLLDSYTADSYANKWVMDNLEENIKNNKDFLGRNFVYYIDESELPQWLLEHKNDYKHLFRQDN